MVERILKEALRSSKIMSDVFFDLELKCIEFAKTSMFTRAAEGYIAY